MSLTLAGAAAAPAGAAREGAAATAGMPRFAVEIEHRKPARSTVFTVTTLGECAAIGGLDLCTRTRLEATRSGRRLFVRTLRRPSVFAPFRTTVRWPCAASGTVRWKVSLTDLDTFATGTRRGSLSVPGCRC